MRNRMPRPDGADGQQTIRILVFVPITLLLLTIVVFAALTGQFNDSISAYYGGPARDVFVGCLTAAALGWAVAGVSSVLVWVETLELGLFMVFWASRCDGT